MLPVAMARNLGTLALTLNALAALLALLLATVFALLALLATFLLAAFPSSFLILLPLLTYAAICLILAFTLSVLVRPLVRSRP
jgi:hypothetical protein